MSSATATASAGVAAPAAGGATPRQLFWRRFKQDKAALAGLFVIGLLVLVAIAGGPVSEWITGHGPNDQF